MTNIPATWRFVLTAILLGFSLNLLAGEYFPPRGEWERKTPESMGFNTERFEAALVLAQEQAIT